MPYLKLDCGITESSIWMEDSDTVRIWIYLLTKADPFGSISTTIPAIARDNLLTKDRVRDILEAFSKPDSESRDPEHEGRRIRITRDPTWEIELLNYSKYRIKDHTSAERARRYRERQASRVTSQDSRDGTPLSCDDTRDITQAEAEAEADKEQPLCEQSISTSGAAQYTRLKDTLFVEFWAEYPIRRGRKPCSAQYKRLLDSAKDPRGLHEAIMAGLKKLKATCRKWKDGFVPNPETFLRQERWNDEPETTGTRSKASPLMDAKLRQETSGCWDRTGSECPGRKSPKPPNMERCKLCWEIYPIEKEARHDHPLGR